MNLLPIHATWRCHCANCRKRWSFKWRCAECWEALLLAWSRWDVTPGLIPP